MHTLCQKFGSTLVDVRAPGKRASSADLQVALDSEQLGAVFDFLSEDCTCDGLSKREYNRTGKFTKRAKEA